MIALQNLLEEAGAASAASAMPQLAFAHNLWRQACKRTCRRRWWVSAVQNVGIAYSLLAR
jgi:hypothetical protein